MRSVAPMRVAKIGYISVSVLFAILGVLMILCPSFPVRVVGITCGILLIIFGGIKMVGFFSKDLFRLAFEHDRACGILMIVLGCCLFLHTQDALSFFCTVLGILVLTDIQPSPPSVSAAQIRAKRNELLQRSDWTQSNDSPLSADVKAAWATYRQQLRDITEQADFPRTVVFPNTP